MNKSLYQNKYSVILLGAVNLLREETYSVLKMQLQFIPIHRRM
jgi:hypothetical protein